MSCDKLWGLWVALFLAGVVAGFLIGFSAGEVDCEAVSVSFEPVEHHCVSLDERINCFVAEKDTVTCVAGRYSVLIHDGGDLS